MKIKYQRSLGRNYMIIRELEEPYTRLEEKMMEHNRIHGVMPGQLAVSDGVLEAWYDITGMQPLDFYLQKGNIGYEMLVEMIEGIKQAVWLVREYLLNEEGLCLSGETIYFDMNQERLVICYVPAGEMPIRENMQALVETLLQKVDHGDKRAVDYIYQIYRHISGSNSSILDVEYEEGVFCDTSLKMSAQPQVWEEPEEEIRDRKMLKKRNWGEEAKNYIRNKGRQMLDFKPVKSKVDDYICNPPRMQEEMYPTVLLEKGIEGKLAYLGQRNETDLRPDKNPFVIGKSRQHADGVITSQAVSRIHALIHKEEGHYMIEDLNSVNGTFVNGERLNYREKRELEKNDIVTFACEEYRFL